MPAFPEVFPFTISYSHLRNAVVRPSFQIKLEKKNFRLQHGPKKAPQMKLHGTKESSVVPTKTTINICFFFRVAVLDILTTLRALSLLSATRPLLQLSPRRLPLRLILAAFSRCRPLRHAASLSYQALAK